MARMRCKQSMTSYRRSKEVVPATTARHRVRRAQLFGRQKRRGRGCAFNDVTERMAAQDEQRERAWQNERYRILSELTHSISFDYDSQSDTVLLYIDRSGNGMEAQVIPHYLETLAENRIGVVHPDSIEAVRSMFEGARNGGGGFAIEYRADYYGRGYEWYRANLFVAHDAGQVWHLVGLIESIESERELRKRAEYDQITGLTNYATTKDLVNAALADSRMRTRCACAVLDIDDFKLVNDSSGHIEGDALLHEVGAILRTSFRDSDIVGRVGGDEFVLLLKDIDLDVAVEKLRGVSRRVSQASVPRLLAAPSVSIGVYRICTGDLTYRDVVVKADDALYRAKRAGKSRIAVYSEAGAS